MTSTGSAEGSGSAALLPEAEAGGAAQHAYAGAACHGLEHLVGQAVRERAQLGILPRHFQGQYREQRRLLPVLGLGDRADRLRWGQ